MAGTNEPVYRRDIDGLRAVAVLIVIAYHYGSSRVSGGYVGVDVFFVISGFLITAQLLEAIEGKRFSILSFYDRRLRRIMPAFVVMILGTLLLGYAILVPGEYRSLGASAIWSGSGVANFYFYRHSGYFDQTADMMPLLHTWSLAVEEQFYVFWPLLLFLLARSTGGSRRRMAAAVGALIAASFLAASVIVRTDQAEAFYMLHTRAWELSAGSLLVFVPPLRWRAFSEAAGVLGLVLIALAATQLKQTSLFPGPNALAPVLGAALIILPTTNRTLASRLLSMSPAVAIGKISYSLYLWHSPVLVFYRQHQYGKVPNDHQTLALIALSFALAIVSYFFVERPFRRLRPRQTWTVAGGIASVACLAALGGAIVVNQGLPNRFSKKALAYLTFVPDPMTPPEKTNCFLTTPGQIFSARDCIEISQTKPNVLLIGDSHSAHYAEALRRVYPEISLSQISAAQCLPALPLKGLPSCVAAMHMAFDDIVKGNHFDAIILSARWTPDAIDRIAPTVEALSPRGEHITVLGRSIEYTTRLPRLLAIAAESSDPEGAIKRGTNFSVWDISEAIAQRLRGTAATYVSVLEVVCPNRSCPTVSADGNPIIFDLGHYTPQGAIEVITKLRAHGLLQDVLRSAPHLSAETLSRGQQSGAQP